MIAKEYTLSLGAKSKLLPHLESWRGKKFTEDEKNGFDVASVLGTACTIQVVHKTSKQGKTRAEVQNIMKLHKSIEAPKNINPLIKFDLSEWNEEVFTALPKFIQDKIMQSEEMKSKNNVNPQDIFQ